MCGCGYCCSSLSTIACYLASSPLTKPHAWCPFVCKYTEYTRSPLHFASHCKHLTWLKLPQLHVSPSQLSLPLLANLPSLRRSFLAGKLDPAGASEGAVRLEIARHNLDGFAVSIFDCAGQERLRLGSFTLSPFSLFCRSKRLLAIYFEHYYRLHRPALSVSRFLRRITASGNVV